MSSSPKRARPGTRAAGLTRPRTASVVALVAASCLLPLPARAASSAIPGEAQQTTVKPAPKQNLSVQKMELTPAENVALLRTKAEKGDPDAQFGLAYAYATGNGIAQDYVQAANWFRKAADQGHALALYNLAVCYASGQGVKRDEAQAARLYRLAADHGDTRAQFNLGMMYSAGQGVKQDYVEAAKWYRKAAEDGFVKAQLSLGVLYANGRGVATDLVEAYKWFALGAERATGNEQKECMAGRDACALRLTREQLAEAQRQVQAFREAFARRSKK